jgi:hypothetical protein
VSSEALMSTRDVAEYLGYTNIRGVSIWARRYGVKPKHRQAGRKGSFNMYVRQEVEDGKKRMLGRGSGGGRPRATK